MASPLSSRTRSRVLRMALLLLIVLALFALGACRTPRSTQSTVVQRDSLVVRWIPRDTLITVPRDSVVLHVHLPTSVPNVGPVRTSNGNATAELSILNGLATVRCMYDSLALELRLWERFQRESSLQQEQRTEVVVEERTPRWAWWSLGSALLLVLWRLWPLLRRLIKPF